MNIYNDMTIHIIVMMIIIIIFILFNLFALPFVGHFVKDFTQKKT